MNTKVVLITGALTGIGRATALAFSKESARLIVSGRRDDAGAKLVKELRELGAEAEYVRADVSIEEDVRNLVAQTLKRFGRIDVAVNNAGTEGKPGPLIDQTVESYKTTFDTNVLGTFLGLKHELKVMIPQGAVFIATNVSLAITIFAQPPRAPSWVATAALRTDCECSGCGRARFQMGSIWPRPGLSFVVALPSLIRFSPTTFHPRRVWVSSASAGWATWPFSLQTNGVVKFTLSQPATAKKLKPINSGLTLFIILNASTTSIKGTPAFSVYSATKAAVRSFARNWTLDLKERKIRVNAVSPGVVPTPGYDLMGLTKEQVEGFVDFMIPSIPLDRVGIPDEIAKAVVFLASDDSSFVNGIELFVDGGMAQI